MLSSLLVLGGGLLLLLWGGYVLLPGTISLAQHLRLPAPLIAIGIIAAGTSMPELLVSVDAALIGTPEIAWGNLLGSNIANLLLVLGLGSQPHRNLILHHSQPHRKSLLNLPITLRTCPRRN